MNQSFATPPSNQRLILIFLGWGMDAAPFSSLSKPGYDIMLLSDYSGFRPDEDTDLLAASICNYQEIVVMAWSFGVRIAADFLAGWRRKLPITRAVAINGTTEHISDSCGIPLRIFQGTLENLSPQSVRKFNRRMFNTASEFQAFIESDGCRRPFESLRKELETFAEMNAIEADTSMWDMAIIGLNDAIIPASNQQLAWRSVSTRLLAGAPHFPDLQHIIDCEIIDKQLVARRFAGAATSYGQHASAQETVAAKLWNLAKPFIYARISNNTGDKKLSVLEVGCGCGTLTRHFSPMLANHRIELCDIAPAAPRQMPPGATFHCCDAETDMSSRGESTLDIVLSSSTLQWFNSPQTFLRNTLRTLRPGGIAAISLFGPETYREISSITGISLNYPDLSSLTSAINNCAEMLHCEETILTERFDNPRSLLRHMKLTGVNALTPHSPASALKLLRNYPLAPSGEAPLTYHPIYLIFSKPK